MLILETVGQKHIKICKECDEAFEKLKRSRAECCSKECSSKYRYRKRKIYDKGRIRDWKTKHQVNKRYGITVEEYKEAMASSDKCQCCGRTKELCYDHDHETMKFRGVLCRACNRSIGQLGDNIEGLEKALAYLKGIK